MMGNDGRRLGLVPVMLLAAPLLAGCALSGLLVRLPGTSAPAPSVPAPVGSPRLANVAVAGDLAVETVEVQASQTVPGQVTLVVRGNLPDSCTGVGEIRQERQGNTITVTITIVRPVDALCAQELVPVEQTVPLVGDFPSGVYTVTVNGAGASFRV